MKKLTLIIFEDDLEISKYSDCIFEKFSGLPKQKEFCGIWGEISFNKEDVLSAISDTLNCFINDMDKTEIVFGCCVKDADEIVSKVNDEECVVEKLLCQNLII